MSFTLPKDYGYVMLSIAASGMVNLYLMFQVGAARKKYGVKYPALYAEESHKHAKEFNSVQRAHQNTLENMPLFLIMVTTNGLVFPKVSAAMGFVFAVGRFFYGYGYAKYGPRGRMVGAVISHLADIPILFVTAYTGYKLLTAN
mmetsp:Transcript_22257/g.33165  ORF Transcript_22257/g.33165 Transcript_22257/m.33165 type:complete len:144 (+) Transcript_22257:55-486(+)